jgi:hypothetical protein
MVPAGEHGITVTVTSGDGTQELSGTTRRIFDPEVDSTLQIKVLTGLSRGLELSWR